MSARKRQKAKPPGLDRKALVGRVVRFTDANRGGTRCGVVRQVARNSKTIVVQLPGGPKQLDGSTFSARCRGQRWRVDVDQVAGIVDKRATGGLRSLPWTLDS